MISVIIFILVLAIIILVHELGHFIAAKKNGLIVEEFGFGFPPKIFSIKKGGTVYSLNLLPLGGFVKILGEDGNQIHDEPQHVKQGKVTLKLLEAMDTPYDVLEPRMEVSEIDRMVTNAVSVAKERKEPYALVVRKGVFEEYKLQSKAEEIYTMSREDAIKEIYGFLDEERDIVISPTGMASRELFEHKAALGQDTEKSNFRSVGSMGHCPMIGMGIALAKPERQVYVFEGDGGAIMHMGTFGIVASRGVKNYKQIVFNNGAHDSVGGQPTVGDKIDIAGIAKLSGYKAVFKAETPDQLRESMKKLKEIDGPAMLEVFVKKGARKDLGRPTKTPKENKEAIMENLRK